MSLDNPSTPPRAFLLGKPRRATGGVNVNTGTGRSHRLGISFVAGGG